ncbi:MAG: di-trans,poly-cis-decaprenylcistransferase, partial [Synergistaceae bacterium]|nr:di-trans,poly-cis-decaprenylcistransferase [Synergistaceae bacterium]
MSETEIKIPRHLAIILDGNGRWAKRRNLPRLMGHRAGLRNLENMVRVVKDKGIRYFSVYAFSTENWNRPVMEVTGLMRLFGYYLRRKVEEIKSMNVRIRF